MCKNKSKTIHYVCKMAFVNLTLLHILYIMTLHTIKIWIIISNVLTFKQHFSAKFYTLLHAFCATKLHILYGLRRFLILI